MTFSYDGLFRLATFERRGPRFVAFVRIKDRLVKCHLPNPGRMNEFLGKGTLVLLKKNQGGNFKTPYTVVSVVTKIGSKTAHLINLNTHIPVKWLRNEFQENSAFSFFKEHYFLRSEPKLGKHRLDLLLKDRNGNKIFCEIKNKTKIIDGIGYFPDAVSKRATSQLKTMYEHCISGGFATVLFLVQSPECEFVAPDKTTDPVFDRACQEYKHPNLNHIAFTSTSQFHGNLAYDSDYKGTVSFKLVKEIPVNCFYNTQI